MAARKRSKPVADLIAQEKAQAAGEAVVADIEANPAAYDAAIENRPAAPDTSVEFDVQKLEAMPARPEPLAGRDWKQFADPAPKNSVKWPDGFEVAVQESSSRKTVEIQFGDGSSRDKPQNHAAVKALLEDSGMRWNGTNAWYADLERPPLRGVESQAEKLERTDRNKALRARIEDEVFPAVVALEEEKRGQVDLSDDFRSRITKATEAHAR